MSHSNIILVPLGAIDVDPEYASIFPPLDAQAYRALKDHISANGILDPLFVAPRSKPGTWVILNGRHRLKILRELNREFAPCQVFADELEQVAALYSDLYRRNLDPATLARLSLQEESMRKAVQARLRSHQQSKLVEFLRTLDEAGRQTFLGPVVQEILASPDSPPEGLEPMPAQASHLVAKVQAQERRLKEQEAVLKDREAKLKEAGTALKKVLDEKRHLQEQIAAQEDLQAGRATTAAASEHERQIEEFRRRLEEQSKATKEARESYEQLAAELEQAQDTLRLYTQSEKKVLQEQNKLLASELSNLKSTILSPGRCAQHLELVTVELEALAQALALVPVPWPEAARPAVAKALHALQDVAQRIGDLVAGVCAAGEVPGPSKASNSAKPERPRYAKRARPRTPETKDAPEHSETAVASDGGEGMLDGMDEDERDRHDGDGEVSPAA